MKYSHHQLLEMDDADLERSVDRIWQRSIEFQGKAESVLRRYNVAFLMVLVVGLATALLGGDRLFVVALLLAAGLIKIYGLISAIEWEVEVVMNNQATAILQLAGVMKATGHRLKK